MFNKQKTQQKPPPPSANPFKVSDVLPGNIDGGGLEIVEVYTKRHDFAIYLARVSQWQKVRFRMLVKYSDQDAVSAKQVLLIDDLLPLRDSLEFLGDDLKDALYYQRRLATALQLALDGKQDAAMQDMKTLVDSASQARAALGRRIYLQWAVGIATLAAFLLIVIGGSLRGGASASGAVLLSGGGGAIGAIFSIALAFRGRSVAPDHDIATNALDGGVRVLIGTIGGAAINLLLSAGFLTNVFPIGGAAQATISGRVVVASWAACLAVGFVAGFLERFVPDLITKFGGQQGGQANQQDGRAPTQGDAGASADKASQATAGKPATAPRQPGPVSSRGGVSPDIGTRLPAVPRAAAAGGPTPTFPNFRYSGGRIVAKPQVFASFWGDGWTNAALKSLADNLTQFLKDLVVSNFVNVLHQYGVGPGEFKTASYVTSNVPIDLKQGDIETLLQSLIDRNELPEPVGGQTCVIVFLKDGISVHDGDTVMCAPNSDDAFGFHYFMQTRQKNLLWYAVIPSLGDDCVKASCPGGDSQCSLKLTLSQERRITQVTSHEYAEMTTDPQLDAWFDPDPNTGEVGDITNGVSSQITVHSRTYTVQAIYSKIHDTGRPGAVYALASAEQPVPLLADGPAST